MKEVEGSKDIGESRCQTRACTAATAAARKISGRPSRRPRRRTGPSGARPGRAGPRSRIWPRSGRRDRRVRLVLAEQGTDPDDAEQGGADGGRDRRLDAAERAARRELGTGRLGRAGVLVLWRVVRELGAPEERGPEVFGGDGPRTAIHEAVRAESRAGPDDEAVEGDEATRGELAVEDDIEWQVQEHAEDPSP